jgi:alpha-tubulin suppressor-like RCC1 family protein
MRTLIRPCCFLGLTVAIFGGCGRSGSAVRDTDAGQEGTADGMGDAEDGRSSDGPAGDGVPVCTARAISAHADHNCALTAAGGVRCWGENHKGALGVGTEARQCTAPTGDVLTGVQSIAPGKGFTCALMTGGGVRCWGDNDYGHLGDGTKTDRPIPPTDDILTGAQAVAAGEEHACALLKTGGRPLLGVQQLRPARR